MATKKKTTKKAPSKKAAPKKKKSAADIVKKPAQKKKAAKKVELPLTVTDVDTFASFQQAVADEEASPLRQGWEALDRIVDEEPFVPLVIEPAKKSLVRRLFGFLLGR